MIKAFFTLRPLDRNIYITIGCITIKFCAGISLPQRMDCNHFGDLPNFSSGVILRETLLIFSIFYFD